MFGVVKRLLAAKSTSSYLRKSRRHAAWAILASTIVVGGLWLATQATDGGLSSLMPRAATASKPAAGYGFATSMMGLPAAEQGKLLDDMKATGATWVRFDLSWAAVQPAGPDSYDWSASDAAVAAASARGFKIVLIVDFTPAWARAANCPDSTMCGPADAAAYGRFAEAAVRHYASAGVKYWELWNEPNINYRFRPVANADMYAAMVKAACPAIKKADPEAVVIAASTAPSATTSKSYSPSDFLTALYEAGAGGCFDAVSAHPYTYPTTPAKANAADAWGQLPKMHAIMEAHGDGAKQLWITEFSAPTNGPNLPGEYVSEAVQAQTVQEAMDIFRAFPWSGPLMWYDYRDAGNRTWTSEDFYGLVRADGSFKPSYYAFKEGIVRNSK